MNLKELAKIPSFEKMRDNIRHMEIDAINALVALSKTADHDAIKVSSGVIEGIRRVSAHIDKEVKKDVDESRRRSA